MLAKRARFVQGLRNLSRRFKGANGDTNYMQVVLARRKAAPLASDMIMESTAHLRAAYRRGTHAAVQEGQEACQTGPSVWHAMRARPRGNRG